MIGSEVNNFVDTNFLKNPVKGAAAYIPIVVWETEAHAI